MNETLSELRGVINNSGYKLITAILVLFIGIILVKYMTKLIKAVLVSSTLDNALVNFILTLLKFLLYLSLILYCLNYIGFSLTGVLTTVTAITLAIGLALQNIIASVANGIMLATTHPFKVNDYVEIGGLGGTVQEVTLIHTVLNTPDGKHVYLPNSSVFSSNIVNFSANEVRRIEILIGVDYSCDHEKVRSIILDVANAHELVLKNPAPQDRYNISDASSVTHVLRVWVLNANYWSVNWDLTEQTFEALRLANIPIPYPQVTVSYRKEG